MNDTLKHVRVALVVVNEGIEEVELTEPWKAVVDSGGQPPKPGMAETMHHLDRAGRFPGRPHD
jgi:protease I